jgi:hypothetical protein
MVISMFLATYEVVCISQYLHPYSIMGLSKTRSLQSPGKLISHCNPTMILENPTMITINHHINNRFSHYNHHTKITINHNKSIFRL